MKRTIPATIVFAALLATLSLPLANTAEPAASDSKPANNTNTKKAGPNRLPNHYGKLGLSDEQREAVYAIQQKYRARIQQLQRQIDELQQQQAFALQDLLTDVQQRQLQSLLRGAEESRADRKTEGLAPDDEPAKQSPK